jgi:hypothetical protein
VWIRLLQACLLAGSTGVAQAQDAGPAALTDAQKERFLLAAKVVDRHPVRHMLTGTERATLTLDGVEHEALIQEIDGYDLKVEPTGTEVGLRDNWRHNVAAYRLDRLLGLRMVPVTVERRDDLHEASFAWWVDGFVMDEGARLKKKLQPPDAEGWSGQLAAVRIFDQLIDNSQRTTANVLVDKDWRAWIIEHSRAFKVSGKLRSAKSLGTRCPRALLAALRRLDKVAIERSMTGLLDGPQIDGLLLRRDAIVRHFEERIAAAGEDEVLYDLPPRPDAAAR